MTTLTDAFLRSSKREQGDYIYDAHNLAVRIGKKRHTWLIKTRTSSTKIGHYPMMTIAQARAVAEERASRIERGIPLTSAAVVKPGVLLTLGNLMDRYELARRPEGLKSLAAGMAVLRNGFKEFAKIELSAFTKLDMRAAHSGMIDGGRLVNGNRFLAYACAMFNWAIDEDLIETNWTKYVKRAKEKGRDRVLSLDELRAIWQATTQLGAVEGQGSVSRRNYLRMVRFLMLTGQRLGDAADLKYGAILGGQWTQTTNKTDKVLRLRLAELALAEVGMGKSPHDRVFASERGQRLNNFDSRLSEIRELSGVADWGHHTFRHTMATLLAEAGVEPHICEALLNHKPQGMAGKYQHASYEPQKQAALAQWAEMIETKVVENRRSA